MASYSDYAKKADELQEEINDADQNTADRKEDADNQLPERFRGKTPEEIAASYAELERKFSKQGNDLGDMRRVLDEHIRLQSTPEVAETTPEESEPISIDDLYENPDEVVRRVVDDQTKERLASLEAQLQQERINTSLAKLTEKFPDWDADSRSDEFTEWVNSSVSRKVLAEQIRTTFDVNLAEELIGDYYSSTKGSSNDQAATAERERQLQDASLESSGAESVETEQTFSRTELMDIRIRANRGDDEASRWLKTNAEQIAIAYEVGNITD